MLPIKEITSMEQSNCCTFCRNIFESSLRDVSDVVLEKCFLDMKGYLECNSFKSCTTCLQVLEDFYTFAITCTNSTQKIKEYCLALNITPEDINLYEVYQFLYCSSISHDSKTNLTSAIKLEVETSAIKLEVEENQSIIPLAEEIERVSGNIKPVKCEEYDLTVKQNLVKHQNSIDVQMFKCNDCTYETKCNSNLNRHVLKHKSSTELKIFNCQECVYETRRKANLKIHLLRHKSPTEAEMFQCEECAYKTVLKSRLKRHCLKHKSPEEVEMFECKECAYETKHKGHLRRHLLKHKSSTKHKSDLKKHFIKHKSPTEVKMFKCTECTYETKSRSYLKIHILQHINPRKLAMFECEHCPFETKYKRSLKAHFIVKHKNFVELETLHKERI